MKQILFKKKSYNLIAALLKPFILSVTQEREWIFYFSFHP